MPFNRLTGISRRKEKTETKESRQIKKKCIKKKEDFRWQQM